MRFFFVLILFTCSAVAKAPECPIFKNKKECLHYVEDRYEDLEKFIRDVNDPFDSGDDQATLLMAAADIKHFEALACEKTCHN